MKNTHKKCCELVKEWIEPGRKVLELSCGKGEILRALKESGYDVCGTNYSEYDDTPQDIDIRAGVDLTGQLPFEDQAFDCVLMCDVIEHIPAHNTVLREVTRITKTNGFVIVLTPNTNRLSSRLHFLLTGFLKAKRAFVGFDVAPDKSFAFHNHPPHLPVYLYQTHSCGLRVVAFDAVRVKPKSVFIWLLLGPWIFPATWLTIRIRERYLKGRSSGELLFKILTSFKALCGESWVVVHQKRPGDPVDVGSSTKLPSWGEKIQPAKLP